MQPFRCILFAADFSENSKEAFRLACSLAVENKTRLFVLHVVDPDGAPEEPASPGRATAQSPHTGTDPGRHGDLKQRMSETYAPSHPIDVAYGTREGPAAEEIARMAAEIGSDLIVMG